VDDRVLLQQALEALEECTAYTSSESWSPSMTRECEAAITALRAAIEQAQEPVAWEFKHRDDAEWKRLIPRTGQTLEAALAELRGYMGVFRRGPLYEVRPPYTAPRQWQGLTGEEVAELTLEHVGYPVRLTEAIEAKLREKNT
jgi:hypothetical protein